MQPRNMTQTTLGRFKKEVHAHKDEVYQSKASKLQFQTCNLPPRGLHQMDDV